MKKLVTMVCAVLTAALMTLSASATELLREDSGKGYALGKNGERVTGLCLIDYDYCRKMCKFDSDGYFKGVYTGWTKTSSGKRSYYKNGVQLFGWNKIGSSWYHFNENGKADTGRVRICGGFYTFDESGKWTGKRSVSAQKPDDFAIRFGYSVVTGTNGFDTAKKTVSKDLVEDGVVTEKASFSVRDLQALYCAYLESGFSEMDTSVYYNWEYGLEAAQAAGIEEILTQSEPTGVFYIEVTLNGSTWILGGEQELQQYASIDETANRLWNFVQILAQYRDGKKEFKNLPAAVGGYE